MKKHLITILILLTVCALLFTACTTSAAWENQNTDTSNTDVNVEKANGSEKYIVYVALDNNGDYIVKNAGTTVSAYAVIGYTGLVSELVIPARYNNKPVTKVLVVPNYASYECVSNGAAYAGNDPRLTNNTVVTSIVFGSNVAYIGAGVCAGMVNVTSIEFENTSAVTLCSGAFAACASLTTVTGTWTPSPAESDPFLASGYTPE